MHPLAETALALWQRQPFEERILLLSQREDVLKTLLRHQAPRRRSYRGPRRPRHTRAPDRVG